MSTHPERIADYLQHILDAIERAMTYAAQAGSVDAFKSHPLLQDGIVRNMEVIGEAAIKLHKVAPDIATAHPDIPWRDMRWICGTSAPEQNFLKIDSRRSSAMPISSSQWIIYRELS